MGPERDESIPNGIAGRIRETGGDRSTAGLPSGRNVCVYLGREQRYVDEADALGRLMAAEGIGLVYGGSRVGLMGVLAGSVLASGAGASLPTRRDPLARPSPQELLQAIREQPEVVLDRSPADVLREERGLR